MVINLFLEVIPQPEDNPKLNQISSESQHLRFNSLGLVYHKTWSLYSCIQCEKGIPPVEIKGHMRKQHRLQYDSERKEELIQALRLYPGRDPCFIEVYPTCNSVTCFIMVLI